MPNEGTLNFRRPRRAVSRTDSGYQGPEKMTTVRDEFRWRNLFLHHSDPSIFYTCQWRIRPSIYVAYRLVTAIFCICWILIIAVLFPSMSAVPYPAWAFLTNWSYFVLTCHLTLAAVISLIHSVEDYYDSRASEQEPLLPQNASEQDLTSSTHSLYTDSTIDHILVRVSPMPWYMKLDWVLYNINTLAAPFVSIVFFVFLYPHMHAEGFDLINFIVHGTNSILTAIELLLCAIPLRLLHIVYPLVYGIIYLIFSLIYWSFDHTRVIYPVILDWNNPGVTLSFLAGAIVGIVILWGILFLIARIRKWIFIRFALD